MENEDLFLQRYKHHINLGGFGIQGQEALQEAKILVAGTSGPGIALLLQLAALGAGSLGIVAPGAVVDAGPGLQSLSDLNLSGNQAIQSLDRKLKDLNPAVKTAIYKTPLNPGNVLKIFSAYDMVISVADNRGYNLLINDASVISGIPFLYGTVQKYEGRVGVFNYKGNTTLRCMYSDAAIEQETQTTEETGFLGALPGIIGGYLAAEAVKIISGIGDVLAGKLLTVNLLTNSHKITRIAAVPENVKITDLRLNDYASADGPADPHARAMTPHQLSLKLSYQESLQLVDIREPDQQAIHPVKNSLHLPGTVILGHLDRIHQDIPVILISSDGQLGKEISNMLNESYGFGNIYYLEGGIEALAE